MQPFDDTPGHIGIAAVHGRDQAWIFPGTRGLFKELCHTVGRGESVTFHAGNNHHVFIPAGKVLEIYFKTTTN